MSKRMVALVTSLAGALAGGWLMLAPFALGYRSPGAPWNHPTEVDFWTGLGVVVVAVVAAVASLAALQGALRASGALPPRLTRAERAALAAARKADPGAAAGSTEQPARTQAAPTPAELRDLLTPLVQALLSDLGPPAGGAGQPTGGADQPTGGADNQVGGADHAAGGAYNAAPAAPPSPSTARYS